MTHPFKIGYVQFAPTLDNLTATLDDIDRLLTEHISQQPPNLLVLPELCNSGYNFTSTEQAFATSEPVDDSRFIDHLAKRAAEYGMHIVSGLNERAGDKLYNSAILVSPTGTVNLYRKLHLFLNEKDFFEPGDIGLPVFDIGGCSVGMLVCFDWIFPETWRTLALKGADVICHPSNLVLPGLCQSAVPSHALVNRVYIVTANRIGTEGDLTFTGLSTIANPRGQVLSQAKSDKETVSLVEIDLELARDKSITHRNDIFVDRRPEFYDVLHN